MTRTSCQHDLYINQTTETIARRDDGIGLHGSRSNGRGALHYENYLNAPAVNKTLAKVRRAPPEAMDTTGAWFARTRLPTKLATNVVLFQQSLIVRLASFNIWNRIALAV